MGQNMNNPGFYHGFTIRTNCFGVNFCLKEKKIMTKQDAAESIELTLTLTSKSLLS
jgi:hypothetical protein